MKSFVMIASLAAAAAVVAGCGGGAALGSAAAIGAAPPASAPTTSAAPLRVVSTPNPNVFALLLAMSRQPNLPVTLVPIAEASQIDSSFASGQADALLAMTYTMAKKVTTGAVPELQLTRVNLWRGFTELAPAAANVTSFSQLVGKGLLVSGPTSGGKNGGPDLIFQAALRRAGFSASDFKICYLPVMQAAPMIVQQQKMNSNPACDPSFDFAPSGISLVEPAATGLIMQSLMPSTNPTVAVQRAVDMQTLFTGYRAWPASQLPHGGLGVLRGVLDDPSRQAVLRTVFTAYDAAVHDIANATLMQQMQIAQTISAGITKYYGHLGLELPAPVVLAALRSKELVIRGDLALAAVQPDLNRFLTEVVGTAPPATFYRAAVNY